MNDTSTHVHNVEFEIILLYIHLSIPYKLVLVYNSHLTYREKKIVAQNRILQGRIYRRAHQIIKRNLSER